MNKYNIIQYYKHNNKVSRSILVKDIEYDNACLNLLKIFSSFKEHVIIELGASEEDIANFFLINFDNKKLITLEKIEV